MSLFGVTLVRIISVSSLIRTEYGEMLSIFPHSVRMWENVGKIRTRIPPNTDTFYAVTIIPFYSIPLIPFLSTATEKNTDVYNPWKPNLHTRSVDNIIYRKYKD